MYELEIQEIQSVVSNMTGRISFFFKDPSSSYIYRLIVNYKIKYPFMIRQHLYILTIIYILKLKQLKVLIIKVISGDIIDHFV